MNDPVETEALLSRFRDWLRTVQDEAEAADREVGREPIEADGSEVGLLRLVEEFSALRHEVKLQTKGARGLQEQAEALLPNFREAIEQFQAVAPREAQAAFQAGRPLALALADLDVALERGRDELDRALDWLDREPGQALGAALERLHASQGWLARFLTRRHHDQVRALVSRRADWLESARFAALREGFDLIQQRLQRAMEAQDLRRIDALGRPVDPERMIVVEVVAKPDQPPGIVLEEVRRGYTWRDRVLREAEVRASARPPSPCPSNPAPID